MKKLHDNRLVHPAMKNINRTIMLKNGLYMDLSEKKNYQILFSMGMW